MSSSLTLIMGPMFSGKSSELIRRIRRAKIRNQNIQVIKPDIDKRYEENMIATHDGAIIESLRVGTNEIKNLAIDKETNFIAIDEAQFFIGLYDFVVYNMKTNRHIVVAGLNGDYKKKRFGEISDLIPIATKTIMLSSICSCCGKKAHYTLRKTHDKNQVLVGESSIYEPRCFKCWEEGMVKNHKKTLIQNI